MTTETRTLLERISARIRDPRPGTRSPAVGRHGGDSTTPQYEGEDSPRLASCSQQLLLSDSEEKKHVGSKPDTWRGREPDLSDKKRFTFPEQRLGSSVNISDSSDEEFENFLVQLKTPKVAPKKTTDKPSSSLKCFIVDDDEDFQATSTKGDKGPKSRSGMKISGAAGSRRGALSVAGVDSPVFLSDSDEDSIVIRSTWTDRGRGRGQRSMSEPKHSKENRPKPQSDNHSARPELTERREVPEATCCTPVSSDDEFQTLIERNRTTNHTPRNTTSSANPPAVQTGDGKAPCSDLTNKKKLAATPRPPSAMSRSPHFSCDHPVEGSADDVEECRPGNMSVPCKVRDCFLQDLSHPTSVYVKDFKQRKLELTSRLYTLYNRTVFDEKLPNNLEILWNKKMRKTAGYCVTGQKKLLTLQRYARIELSEKVCDSADRLRDTLIHEICHAATWLINGVRDGHGQYWRFYARKATLIHPELPMVTRCHTYEINYKFTYECSRCKNTIGRHSKSLDTERFVCALCKGKLVLQPARGKDGSPATSQLTPFAKFVKENYGCTKRGMSGGSHAEVMRKLSADFSAKTKIS